MAEKSAHLLLNGQNVFAEQLGSEGGDKGGLAGVEQIDFAALRNHLQVSDSVLSRQASQLEGLGIVAVRKGYIGKRPRTWFSLTPKGRKLWKSHLAALRAIADGSVPTTSGEGS